MNAYPCKNTVIAGSSYDEKLTQAHASYHTIKQRNPRRKAYVKSRFFGKDKVFMEEFWMHLRQKPRNDQARRIGFYNCAIELIRKTTCKPETIRKRKHILLHRFNGRSQEGRLFYVQIRENTKTGRKDFMSVFPT